MNLIVIIFFQKIISKKEIQCKEHKLYKEAMERLLQWLDHAQEKIPSMKERSLSDKLAIENMLTPLEAILNTKIQADELLENVKNRSLVILPSLSKEGQENINSEIIDLQNKLKSFFDGIIFINITNLTCLTLECKVLNLFLK